MLLILKISRLILYLPIFLYYRVCFKGFGWRSVIKSPSTSIVGKKYIVIGKSSIILKHARIEAVTHYGSKSYTPKLRIGDNVVINQNFHCTCAESVFIGEGTSITANCGVFDIIHPYQDINVNPRIADIEVNPVRIGKNCLIGMNSVILPGSILGDHCIVGANSTVSGKFPSYSVIVGSPAKIIKSYNISSGKWDKIG